MPADTRDARQNGKKPMDTPALNRAARAGKPTQDQQLFQSPAEKAQPQLPFTETDPWRVLRIMGEFVEGFDTLADLGPAVTFFGSARVKRDDPMYQQAVEVARKVGESGFAIITGGGPGIMEAVNKGACEAGAKSIGLNIELPFEQSVNPYVDIAIEFHYFFVRKTMFVKYAQAFVIFPGGFGTMDELFEALTLIQTGKVLNFPVVLVGTEYWRGLIDWLRNAMLAQGKISPPDVDLLYLTDSPDEVCELIMQSIKGQQPQRVEKEEQARAATAEAHSPERYKEEK